MTETSALTLEVNDHATEGTWLYRVKLTAEQSIIGTPRNEMIMVSFVQARESLAVSATPWEIYDQIAHDKADDSITAEDCITAIQMIQHAAKTGGESL
jgi:hypothetical protein